MRKAAISTSRRAEELARQINDQFWDDTQGAYVGCWMFEDDKTFRIEVAEYRPTYNPNDYLDESKDWFH